MPKIAEIFHLTNLKASKFVRWKKTKIKAMNRG